MVTGERKTDMTGRPYTEDEPLYVQEVLDIITKKLEAGEFLAGERLPSERKLAEIYGVNRMTVKNAINALADKGYLYRIHGKGTFVQKKDISKLDLGFFSESGNTGITAIVNSQGIRILNKVLEKGVLGGERFFSGKLSLHPEEDIFALHRIRYGNSEPIGVEYTYVPLKYFPDIDSMDFGNVSLYDYMQSRHHMPVVFNQKFQVIEVSEREGRHLKLQPGQPVYYFEFIGADAEGAIVEYTESYIRTDKAQFRFTACV